MSSNTMIWPDGVETEIAPILTQREGVLNGMVRTFTLTSMNLDNLVCTMDGSCSFDVSSYVFDVFTPGLGSASWPVGPQKCEVCGGLLGRFGTCMACLIRKAPDLVADDTGAASDVICKSLGLN